MYSKFTRVYLFFEFSLLFLGIPLFIRFFSDLIHPSFILVPTIVGVILLLTFTTDFSLRELIIITVKKKQLIRNGIFLSLSAMFLLFLVMWMTPGNLFDLPEKHFRLWVLLCASYPLLSAYPQEIIYRLFLFKRYKRLLSTKILRITASAVTFGFAHIIYGSGLSVMLTLVAGFYLAWVYTRTKSVLYTTILHCVFGFLVFTLGLGQYFILGIGR